MARIGCLLLVLIAPSFALAAEKPKPGFIGVQIGIGDKPEIIVVRLVFNNSPADKAGLKPGDQILRINNAEPANLQTTVKVIRSLEPGKKAKLLIQRDGKEMTLEVVPVAVDE
jgi:S1-C subfamily serine protease